MNLNHSIRCGLLIGLFFISGCSTGVVPLGQDTYMIAGSSPGLIGSGTVKAKLIRQANEWAAKKGLVASVVDSKGEDAVAGRNCANAEIIFKALPPDRVNEAGPVYRAPNQIIETRTR
jgi:hypothetical protein